MILPLPGTFERHTLRTRRGTVKALHHPAVNTRATVVMTCGYFGTKEDYRLVMPELAAAGYDCWAYDYVDQFGGDGLSSASDYEIALLADDLAELVDGRRVHYVGHCLGGLVARHAVLDAPGQALSLTLLCTGPHLRELRHKAMWLAVDKMLSDGGLMNLWPTVRRLLPKDDVILGEFWQNKLATMNHAFVQGTSLSMRAAPDLTEALRDSGVPVLTAYGSRDRRLWSQDTYHAMAERLGSREVVFKGAAHSPSLETPAETIAALLELWSSVEVPA
ncbi:alpha/beta hydrolase [Actinocorallia longicatena]|uniref:AB hydrolase-1 domain-containing protein n=1 Tax=Actinocorallia longicatena TaxID=111803 RepID=A0ABP6QJI4_9ACTN